MTYLLETQIENLRAEVNRLNNVIAERDMQIDNLKAEIEAFTLIKNDNAESAAAYDAALKEAERRGFEAARDAYDTAAKADCKVGGYIYKHETFDDYQRSKSQEGQS